MLDWTYLGTFAPKSSISEGLDFTFSDGIFKVKTISPRGFYERFCSLRIKYSNSGNIVFTKWFRYYPSPENRLFKIGLDSRLATWTKCVQIIELPDRYGILYDPLSWAIELNIMGV